MPGKTLILLCLLIVLPASDALAKFKGLFLLGSLNQGVVLDYNYYGEESMPKGGRDVSTSQSRFTETYNAGIEYSILDPNILNGRLKVGLQLNQEIFSSPNFSGSATGDKFFYNLDGAFLKRSPTPINFISRSEFRHVQRPFTPGYDLTTDSYGAGVTYRHKFAGFRFDYLDTTAETSGTTSDSRQTNSFLSLVADNVYKNSATQFQVTHAKSRMEPLFISVNGVTEDVSYNFSAKNTIVSDSKDKTLSSNVKYRSERLLDVTKTFAVAEALNWQLGKALTLDGSYEYTSVSTEPAEPISIVAATENKQHNGTVLLTHRLFKSLTTRLRVQGRLTDLAGGGRETVYSGTADFFYIKKLSELNTLTLNYSEQYTITDRHLALGTLQAINEPLTAQLTGNNLLLNPNVVQSSVVVRDAANPLIVYENGRDYTFIKVGVFTGFDFSVFGSRITDGQNLLVTYEYNVDSTAETRSTVHSGGGSLSLDKGVYLIYANISQSSLDLISGQSNLFRPSSSLDYTIGATRDKKGIYTNIVYVATDSIQNNRQYLEGTFRITRYFGGSSLNAQARDRQTWYGATSYNPVSYTENQLSLSADYSRNVFSNGVLTLRGGFFRTAASSRERYDASFETIYRWALGKVYLEATGRVLYRDNDGDQALDSRFHLRVSRYF